MRDIAQCSPSAGIVPCHLLDFRRTLSAVEFYGKMERLYEQHLRNHCNNEWNVHFHALLLRLKGSLTCAGGLKPDHPIPGFKPQPAQPAIQGKVLRFFYRKITFFVEVATSISCLQFFCFSNHDFRIFEILLGHL